MIERIRRSLRLFDLKLRYLLRDPYDLGERDALAAEIERLEAQ